MTIGSFFGMTQGRTHNRLRIAVLAFAASFVILLIALEAFVLWLQRGEAIAAAEQRAQSFARVLSAHMKRTVGAVDAALKQLTIEAKRLLESGYPEGSGRRLRPMPSLSSYAASP